MQGEQVLKNSAFKLVTNLSYNGLVEIIPGLLTKTSPAESLRPLRTQKKAHKNSASLKSSTNQTS